MLMTTYERAADNLAAQLRDEPWYHRTSMSGERLPNGEWIDYLRVWGEGTRPANLPHVFEEYVVEWCKVSKKHPCPFGSVKPEGYVYTPATNEREE